MHAADDRSVMETLEALPYQVTHGAHLHRQDARTASGPSAIGCRDNPHGATFTPNPDNQRVCLVEDGSAPARACSARRGRWAMSPASRPPASRRVSLGAPTGPLGIMHRRGRRAGAVLRRPRPRPAVYPAFHVVAGLTRAAGA